MSRLFKLGSRYVYVGLGKNQHTPLSFYEHYVEGTSHFIWLGSLHIIYDSVVPAKQACWGIE